MSENETASDSDLIPTTAIVLYHDHCVDGFGAAWAFHRLADGDYDDVAYLPCQYGKPVPEIETTAPEKTDIFVLDFSFDRATLAKLALAYGSVTVLDHHKSAADILIGWEHGLKNLEIVFDMGRSGAGITWDYLTNGDTTRPPLINYIEDRDIWVWNLQDSRELSALIGFTKKEFPAYSNLNRLMTEKYDQAVAMGTLLLEQQERHVDSIIEATKQPITINGQAGLVCNCPGQFASDVGNKLAVESGTFGATYFTSHDGSVKFSLRSASDFNVRVIAQQFGGGGHDKAAGFTITQPIDNAMGTGVTLWNLPKQVDDFPDDYEV